MAPITFNPHNHSVHFSGDSSFPLGPYLSATLTGETVILTEHIDIRKNGGKLERYKQAMAQTIESSQNLWLGAEFKVIGGKNDKGIEFIGFWPSRDNLILTSGLSVEETVRNVLGQPETFVIMVHPLDTWRHGCGQQLLWSVMREHGHTGRIFIEAVNGRSSEQNNHDVIELAYKIMHELNIPIPICAGNDTHGYFDWFSRVYTQVDAQPTFATIGELCTPPTNVLKNKQLYYTWVKKHLIGYDQSFNPLRRFDTLVGRLLPHKK